MQVEVSKYTEGAKEKARRPNGLPSSLIRYDGTATLSCFSPSPCLATKFTLETQEDDQSIRVLDKRTVKLLMR